MDPITSGCRQRRCEVDGLEVAISCGHIQSTVKIQPPATPRSPSPPGEASILSGLLPKRTIAAPLQHKSYPDAGDIFGPCPLTASVAPFDVNKGNLPAQASRGHQGDSGSTSAYASAPAQPDKTRLRRTAGGVKRPRISSAAATAEDATRRTTPRHPKRQSASIEVGGVSMNPRLAVPCILAFGRALQPCLDQAYCCLLGTSIHA